ncbi:MAG: PIN domain-containing protein [Candidatus Latescibacteria bacterium]|nr:PIN domain-containing protein [Candidatus Latescibacterota bacterium]
MKLFLDANILLDVLAQREPWVGDSAAVLSLVDTGVASGFVAAHTITTLHYLLRKHAGQEKAGTALVDLLDLVRVAAVDEQVIRQALSMAWRDFEDAVQAVCALRTGVDYFVTRNPRDFAALSIPVVRPAEVLGWARD